MNVPQFKQLRRAYGFDEVAIVPGNVTVNPDQTNIELKIGEYTFAIPIIAAAMDGVTTWPLPMPETSYCPSARRRWLSTRGAGRNWPRSHRTSSWVCPLAPATP